MLTDGKGANAARGGRQAERRYEGLCRPATRLGGRAHLLLVRTKPASRQRTSKTAPKPWPHSSSSPPSSLTSDALLGVVGTRQTLAATGEAGCGFGERTLAGARGNDGDAPTAALGTSPAQVTAGDPFPDLPPDAEAPATPGLSQNRLCDCVLVGDHLVAR